jgi:hypothetical protein
VSTEDIVAGHANIDGALRRGWFVGGFMAPGTLHAARGVEMKWGVHQAGDTRGAWGRSTWVTISLLVSGRFRLLFEDGERLLTEPGEYVVWAPGVAHTWVAESDSVILTVRWPAD